MAGEVKTVVVVDTSVFIKRPIIVNELVNKFNEVLIPEIVVAELNNIKDGPKPQNKQRAWLAMVNLKRALDENMVQYCRSPRSDGNNDVRIAAVATERAGRSPSDKVYMLSDDIYFSYLVMESRLTNIEALTISEYGRRYKKETACDRMKSQAFYAAVKSGQVGDLRRINMENVDINMIDAETELTPLIQATRGRKIEIVRYLTELPGIDLDKPDQQKYNFTPLLHAAQLKDSAFEIFKLLIDRGADYEKGSSGKNAGNTPLMVCAWGGFMQGAEYLLMQNVCVNQQDTNGFTALIKACIRKHYGIGLLLAQRTDVTIRSHENKRADEYITDFRDIGASELIREINGKR